MKITEFLSKGFFTDGSDLSRKQRVLVYSLICVPYIVFSFAAYAFTNDPFALKIMIILLICISPLIISFVFADKLNEKYGRFSEIRFGYTYQRGIHSVSYAYLTFMGMILFITSVLNKLLLGALLSFSFAIPFISAFFRTDVFNDSSCYLDDEIVLGYQPTCHTFSILAGLLGFYNTYALLNVNYDCAILLFVITVLFQIIFVIPNWANKIVPFEIRKKEGFILYNVLTGAVYLLILYCIIGNTMFPPIHINLTPEGIIRKIITYGIGIILLILIIKQGKNMGKKEK